MKQNDIALAKSVLWAEAKGKLEALSNAESCRVLAEDIGPGATSEIRKRWVSMDAAIKTFISVMEDEGFCE